MKRLDHFAAHIPLSSVLLFYLSVAALAQIISSSIVGSVTDATGAVVPRVSISVTNESTGIARQASSDESGGFVMPQLQPGNYRLAATAPGFRRYEVSSISLLVDQTLRVDVHLTLGDVAEQIEVAARGAQIESETSSRTGH